MVYSLLYIMGKTKKTRQEGRSMLHVNRRIKTHKNTNKKKKTKPTRKKDQKKDLKKDNYSELKIRTNSVVTNSVKTSSSL